MTAPEQAEAKQKGELPPRVFVVLDHFGGPQCVHVVEGNASDSTAAFANALNRACRYVPYVPEAALSEMREERDREKHLRKLAHERHEEELRQLRSMLSEQRGTVESGGKK